MIRMLWRAPAQGLFAIAALGLVLTANDALAAGWTSKAATTPGNQPPDVRSQPDALGWDGCPVLIPVTVMDPEGDPITSLAADLSGLPAGNDAKFVVNAAKTAGMFTWHPGSADIGSWNVSFNATSNGQPGLGTLTRITVTPGIQAEGRFLWSPTLADTGTFTVTFTATNSDGETSSLPWPLTILGAVSSTSMSERGSTSLAAQTPARGPIISISPPGCDGCGGSGGGGGSGGSGGICGMYGGAQIDTVAVGCDDFSGFFEFVVRAVDAVASVFSLAADTSQLPLGNTASFVPEMFAQPIVHTGGPYSGEAGTPVEFFSWPVVGSSSPYAWTWDFGDASGAFTELTYVEHAYTNPGTYRVSLIVTDLRSQQVSCGTTLAVIGGVLPARAFVANGNASTPLTAQGPPLCIQIEPVGSQYENTQVDLSTIRMYSGTPGSGDYISALGDKTIVEADRDRNGVREITACFGREDLHALFSGIEGRQNVPVTIEAEVKTGGKLSAQLDLALVGVRTSLSASVYPNPLNPTAKLAFTTSRSGPLRVVLFALNGRLVRTLLNRSHAVSGHYEVEIDGRDERGRRLASGIYFYRVEAAEGAVTGRFTILE